MIYFDNSATTRPYPEVLDAFVKTSENYFANPSSLHSLGARTEKLLTQARRQIASLLGADENEIFSHPAARKAIIWRLKGQPSSTVQGAPYHYDGC